MRDKPGTHGHEGKAERENAPQTAPHKCGPWTSGEIAQLRAHANEGARAVAELLGRTVESVRTQARDQRISLRRSGERRGVVLGQPRGESWGSRSDTRRIREAMLLGRIDPTAVEETIARLVAEDPPPLCPLCAARWADHRSGVCRVCHYQALAAAHRDAEALAGAQRELWQARQEKSRTRRGKQEQTA